MAEERSRHLPVALFGEHGDDKNQLAPHAIICVEVPETSKRAEQGVRVALWAVVTVGLLAVSTGGIAMFLAWLEHGAGFPSLASVLLGPLALGAFGLSVVGGARAGRILVKRLWPRPRVATIGVDEDRVVLTLRGDVGSGLEAETFTLDQGSLKAGERRGDRLVVSTREGLSLEVPAHWHAAQVRVGALAPHPRAAATHTLRVERGKVVLRGSRG